MKIRVGKNIERLLSVEFSNHTYTAMHVKKGDKENGCYGRQPNTSSKGRSLCRQDQNQPMEWVKAPCLVTMETGWRMDPRPVTPRPCLMELGGGGGRVCYETVCVCYREWLDVGGTWRHSTRPSGDWICAVP